jgi:hypothetical protein
VQPDAVLVVDDASDDATVELAERWADRLPLRVERLPAHSGVGTARRQGVAMLDQPLVAQLDADDYWLTDHLRAMLDAHEPGRVVFARDFLWSPGSWLRANPRTLPEGSDQLRALLRGNLSSAGVLFTRDAYDRAGGYRESLRSSEDWDLYLRMVRQGAVLTLASEPTLLYRISPSSTSAGYKTAETDVAILEHARDEAATAEERGWAEAALQRRRARSALWQALGAATAGRSSEARSLAKSAVRGGDRKTRMIAAAIVLAPGIAARARAEVAQRRLERTR